MLQVEVESISICEVVEVRTVVVAEVRVRPQSTRTELQKVGEEVFVVDRVEVEE